ncbi:MAG TPA: RidA family protein [Polyangiaceae bacterium]|nr:RidA family protein [Polyangiaceae bacterium]
MPKKKIIRSAQAPAPVASYSQAVRAGKFLFCSGQIPIDPRTHELVGGDIGEQTRRVLDNLGAVLAEAGLGYEDVVKCTVFLMDLADFKDFDAAYAHYFGASPPARSTIGVAALPRGARIELEAIALMR